MIQDILNQQVRVRPQTIMKMADGFQGFMIMTAALDMDIFTSLSEEPKTSGRLAEEKNTDPYMTEKLLNSLVSIELLFKAGGTYYNNELSETYLSKKSPFFQGNFIKTQESISFGTSSYDDWAKFGEALEKGYVPPVGGRIGLYDKIFSLAMYEMAIRGEAQETARILSGYPWLQDARRMIDIGGTHGLYTVALLAKNSLLKATLFDIPGVPEKGNAEDNFARYGVADRAQIQYGNFFDDVSLGSGYDMAFISHVYMIDSNHLLRRVHDSLNPEGRFVLKNSVIQKDRMGPYSSSLLDLDMCFWGENVCMHSMDEYIDQIEPCGFQMESVDILEASSLNTKALMVFKKVI